MEAFYSYLNSLVNKNKLQYSRYSNIKWINPYSAFEYQNQRNKFLENIGHFVLFKGTKPYLNHISEGCNLCGQGLWSCLFITGKCNANCFYCPTAQDKDDVPVSQGLSFPTPESYSEYVNHFGFKGVSFSGGEPLLFSERVLDYLQELRKSCAPDIYAWMYTNGILSNQETFAKLAELNLNEIRFDIGATGYTLENVSKAKGIIKNVSIEIPAVPEEKEVIKTLLPNMIKAGVTNLNLHQLRLTEYNAPKLLKRDYTFIPAEKPIVLESELAALEIIDYAKSQKLDIGINYCSFFFKNRFQAAGFKKQVSGVFSANENAITQKGYIREQNQREINYYSVKLDDIENSSPNSSELALIHKAYAFNKTLIKKISTNPEITCLIQTEPEVIPENDEIFDIWNLEYIEYGLRDY
ncbi:MAG: radical SAM protein [Bacteroidales bacterium]|nr:radical SAM protein [Bacteroidales bacterium]MBN2819547.1 radical SAM protein [Bacteroidales bacterium]